MELERILYFGTADIAVPALEALAARSDVDVVAACTQPDRPSGRKRRLASSPVKRKALDLGLPVLDPERISDAREAMIDLRPDLGVVFAYGQYLPSSVFELPKHGSINFHPSRLPEYRGASPIQSALLDGKTETALTVLQVDVRMDAGDIWMQTPLTIDAEDTSETLRGRFARLAADTVPALLKGLREETLERTPQEEDKVIECGKIDKADGALDWREPAEDIRNRVRAFQPWPGVYFSLGQLGNLKVWAVRVEKGSGRPGEILEAGPEGPLVACGSGALRLLRVQPPGKSAMEGGAFLNGHPLQPGSVLDGADTGT